MIETNKDDLKEIILEARLFKNTAPFTTEYAFEHFEIFQCKKGEKLFDARSTPPSLFLIIKGSVSVYGLHKDKPVILNTLKKGQIFGIASLFGGKCGTTEIVAKESCSYAVLTEESVEHLLKNDIYFTKNYISILSEKIRFLNKKISFFTSGSAEKKLANYILSQPWEDNILKLNFSISRLASVLDIGRASLYRALDSLEENCFITRENNVIKITSPEEFKKIYGETL